VLLEFPMKAPLLLVMAVTALATPAARAQNFTASLTPGEDGGGARTGSGTLTLTLSGTQLTLSGSFSGLSGNANNAHIHGPSGVFPAAAGVLYGLNGITTLGGSSGTINGVVTLVEGTGGFTIAQQVDQLTGNLWYLNVHSSVFGGGEIRGQVMPTPPTMNYWPLDEMSGTTAPNRSFGGINGTLNGGVAWVMDATRGQVLEFDGIGGSYVNATTIGTIGPTDDFSWSFWANANAAQLVNNDIIVGNRQPDSGWCKFTPSAFEFRDVAATFNTNLNYPDMALSTWIHHSVIKRGQIMTYYRNGLAMVSAAAPGTLPGGTPFYFGGDAVATGEGWQGRLDDVATWQSAVPTKSVVSLAKGTVAPDGAPLTNDGSALVLAFADDFATGLANWTSTDRGLENNLPAGYNPPSAAGGEATLGGTTTAQYWYGSSIESVPTFDSRLETWVSVDRVSLTGAGTARRSSVWIFGDDAHYLHFSQNIGENGWQFNARDDGGVGTLLPTGGGNNLAGLDALDADAGLHAISLRVVPGVASGQVNVEMWVDGQFQGVHGFSNFPTAFRVVLTGQGRAIGDSVAAVFDNVLVRQEMLANLPPAFTANAYVFPVATADTAYAGDLAPLASDPESQSLTFSKVAGPAWLTVAGNGAVSGTPGGGDVGLAVVVVQASDGNGGSAQATLRLRVEPAIPDTDVLFGWWPLNEGSGVVAREISGGGAADGTIANVTTGGLGPNGEAWVVDPVCGTVLSFNGEDPAAAIPGSYVTIGNPPATGLLPVIGLEGDFSLSCWVKSDQAPNNDIIIGNRYDATGIDYAPRQFVKLTTSQFEWHRDGVGENIDFVDLVAGVWAHHAVVKDGATFYYYRDGVLVDGRTITGAPTEMLPLYFGGQGLENWRGCLSDVRLYASALSDGTVVDLSLNKGVTPEAFRITSIGIDASRNVILNWAAQPGASYYVFASTNLVDWFEQVDGLTETTFTVTPGGFPDTATSDNVYFRVEARFP
jgi:hypothetical protein